jgi:hypothetical protein
MRRFNAVNMMDIIVKLPMKRREGREGEERANEERRRGAGVKVKEERGKKEGGGGARVGVITREASVCVRASRRACACVRAQIGYGHRFALDVSAFTKYMHCII